MNFKSVISKINLSLIILTSVLGAGCILIWVPIQVYDKYVIEKGQECYEKETASVFSLTELEFLTDDQMNNLIAVAEKAANDCAVEVSLQSKEKTYISKKVIIDNNPNPTLPLYIGLFFFGIALTLYLLKLWVRWLLK